MKRFKKLTIYILVGVLASSSVLLSYKKAETAYASATLTLGTGALLMIGLLGAYGIVYKGATDTVNCNYIWESALPKYEDDINELEQRFKLVWDSSVNQIASGGGYDPNDDWDGDEDKPPTWDNLVDFFNANNSKQFKLGATVMGALLSGISYGLYQESQNASTKKEGVSLTAGEQIDSGFNYISGSSKMGHKYSFQIKSGSDVKCILVEYATADYIYRSYVFASKSQFNIQRAYSYKEYINDIQHWSTQNVGNYSSCSVKTYGVDGSSIYIYIADNKFNPSDEFFNTNLPVVPISYNLKDIEQTRQFLRELFTDEYSWDYGENLITSDSISLGSGATLNNDDFTMEPIHRLLQIPTNETVGNFLGNLVTSTGNQAQTQLAVDQFIDSLQGTETNPEGGVVPNPNPDPSPDPNPNPNPDEGVGEGGEDSSENKDNSTLLADLKNVFPFCIPFDLINCFRLFNSEPVTPRVEIPLHFKLNDSNNNLALNEKYVFVIDLKEFDGVAQVCRSMFLIMFIVGLVMSTRTLIRG